MAGTETLTRRDFLKLAGITIATAGLTVGCGESTPDYSDSSLTLEDMPTPVSDTGWTVTHPKNDTSVSYTPVTDTDGSPRTIPLWNSKDELTIPDLTNPTAKPKHTAIQFHTDKKNNLQMFVNYTDKNGHRLDTMNIIRPGLNPNINYDILQLHHGDTLVYLRPNVISNRIDGTFVQMTLMEKETKPNVSAKTIVLTKNRQYARNAYPLKTVA